MWILTFARPVCILVLEVRPVYIFVLEGEYLGDRRDTGAHHCGHR
jgi:hypothetical protein